MLKKEMGVQDFLLKIKFINQIWEAQRYSNNSWQSKDWQGCLEDLEFLIKNTFSWATRYVSRATEDA